MVDAIVQLVHVSFNIDIYCQFYEKPKPFICRYLETGFDHFTAHSFTQHFSGF